MKMKIDEKELGLRAVKGIFIPLREHQQPRPGFNHVLSFTLKWEKTLDTLKVGKHLMRARLQTSECDVSGLPFAGGAGPSLPLVQLSALKRHMSL